MPLSFYGHYATAAGIPGLHRGIWGANVGAGNLLTCATGGGGLTALRGGR